MAVITSFTFTSLEDLSDDFTANVDVTALSTGGVITADDNSTTIFQPFPFLPIVLPDIDLRPFTDAGAPASFAEGSSDVSIDQLSAKSFGSDAREMSSPPLRSAPRCISAASTPRARN